MDSNTYSTRSPSTRSPSARSPALPEPPDDGLAALAADVDALAAQDLRGLPEVARAQRLLAWRRLLDRQEGLWLKELAALDAGGGRADQGQATASTAGWLRNHLRMSASAARGSVRTARALFCGSLAATAQALVAGEFSAAHARVVVDGTRQLPGAGGRQR